MDLLLAEISNKRKDLASSSPASSQQGNGASKYMRRGDLERAKQEEEKRLKEEEDKRRRDEKERKEKEKKDRLALLRRDRASSSRSPEPGSSRGDTPGAATSGAEGAGASETFNISSAECIRRLRAKGEPILLFGETEKERRLRLRALELLEEREGNGAAAGQGLNDWKKAVETLERDGFAKEIEQRRRTKDGAAAAGGQGVPAPGTGKGKGKEEHEGEREMVSNAPDAASAAADTASADPYANQQVLDLALVKSDPKKVYPMIYYALKGLLKEWGEALEQRPDDIKRSHQGRTAAATQVQTGTYLKPLFKSLRARELEPDVLRLLAEIVHFTQKRQYQKANDAYLRLSIGNAAWPIGVTMVGIHERSAREKIGVDSVAHVLNDEVSRKYIQSVKRLLTFAQTVRPPNDAADMMG